MMHKKESKYERLLNELKCVRCEKCDGTGMAMKEHEDYIHYYGCDKCIEGHRWADYLDNRLIERVLTIANE